MKTYIGTKIVKAKPYDSAEFARLKNRTLSPEEWLNPIPGYLVEYEDGYTSWSPKDTFDRCYREITEAEKKLM